MYLGTTLYSYLVIYSCHEIQTLPKPLFCFSLKQGKVSSYLFHLYKDQNGLSKVIVLNFSILREKINPAKVVEGSAVYLFVGLFAI